jgi:putative colanic acid biosynthesis glycosyltransferase
MRIAGINMIPYGSTGKIMLQIAETARGYGMEVRTYSTIPYNKSKKAVEPDLKNHFVFGSMSENKRHTFLGVLLGRNGCYSRRGTRQLIDDLKQFKPDIVHLHNLHKFCINLPMLFRGYPSAT